MGARRPARLARKLAETAVRLHEEDCDAKCFGKRDIYNFHKFIAKGGNIAKAVDGLVHAPWGQTYSSEAWTHLADYYWLAWQLLEE